MSFSVARLWNDSICLSSTTLLGVKSVQLDDSQYTIRIIHEDAYFATEKGKQLQQLIYRLAPLRKATNFGTLYFFNDRGNVRTACRWLLNEGLMQQSVFEELNQFLIKKVYTVWENRFYPLRYLNLGDHGPLTKQEEQFQPFPESVLKAIDLEDEEAYYHRCYLDRNEWVNWAEETGDPKKALRSLLQSLKDRKQSISIEDLNAVWQKYEDLLLSITEESDISLLFELLHASETYKFWEIFRALVSQKLFALDEEGMEFLFEKIQNALEGNKGLSEAIPFTAAIADHVELWLFLQKKVEQLPATPETLRFQAALFTHIPNSLRGQQVKGFDRWTNQLFKYYFNSCLAPSLPHLSAVIEAFTRNHFPQYYIALGELFDKSFLPDSGEETREWISAEEIVRETAVEVMNALTVSVPQMESDEFDRLSGLLIGECLNGLKGQREVMPLDFLKEDHHLYAEFIISLTLFHPQKSDLALFVMCYARAHLNVFMNQFPDRSFDFCRLNERIALMKMERELFQDIHQRSTQLFVVRNNNALRPHLGHLTLYKFLLFGTHEVKLTLTDEGWKELKTPLVKFVESLILNGSWFHLVTAQECVLSFTPRTQFLVKKVESAIEKYLRSFKQNPHRISQCLRVMPGFMQELTKRFRMLPAEDPQWKALIEHFLEEILRSQTFEQFFSETIRAVTFLNHLTIQRQTSEAVVAATAKLHHPIWNRFAEYFRREFEKYKNLPISEESKQFYSRYTTLAEGIFKNPHLNISLSNATISKDCVMELYRLQHEIPLNNIEEPFNFKDFIENLKDFMPHREKLLTRPKQFLQLHATLGKELKSHLSESKFQKYKDWLKQFVISSHQADKQELYNDLWKKIEAAI